METLRVQEGGPTQMIHTAVDSLIEAGDTPKSILLSEDSEKVFVLGDKHYCLVLESKEIQYFNHNSSYARVVMPLLKNNPPLMTVWKDAKVIDPKLLYGTA